MALAQDTDKEKEKYDVTEATEKETFQGQNDQPLSKITETFCNRGRGMRKSP